MTKKGRMVCPQHEIMTRYVCLIFAGLSIITVRTVYGGACGTNVLVGNSNPQSDKQNLDSENGVSILQAGSHFQVQCDCGEIFQWGHYAGAQGDVYFQVWRDKGSTYELIGENLVTFTASNAGSGTTSISSGTIYAIQNDYIVVYNPLGAVITHGNGIGNVNDFKKTTSVNGASTFDWGSESVDGSANYAYNARLNGVPTNAPTFSNLDGSTSIPINSVVGTTVFTVTVSDVDSDIQSTEMTSSSTYYSFDTSTLDVSIISTPPVGVYPLVFEVGDRCANTATATLTVSVVDPCSGSSSPTFSDATPTASLSTTSAVGTTVSTLTVSDVDGDTLTTVMTSSSTYFSFDTSTLEVTTLSTVPAGTYALTFRVTDTCTNTATATFTVTVVDPCSGSSSPTFSDATPTASISTTSAVGTTVSTLTVSDVDGDTLTTVMTSSSSYFSFDTSSLEVTTLSTVPAGTYTLSFRVTDTCTNTATATLTVTVIDPCSGSSSPTFSDATPTASIPTTSAVGTTVSTLTVSDVDSGTLTTVMTSSSTYFTFDTSSLEVQISSTVPAGSYSLAFQTTDECSNQATSTLSITVLSLSQITPSFSVSTAIPTMPDDFGIGTTVVRLTVTDPDGGTTTTTMTSSSTHFELDPVTLDVKVLSSLTSGTYVLAFQTVDNDGNTGTTQVNITVENSKPLITSLPAYAYLTESTTTETLHHTIVTNDASPSDTVTCSLVASDSSSTDFTVKVISGTSYGIYSLAGHSINYATTKRFQMTINCTDTKDEVSGSFYLYILPNSPPTFTNLPNSTTIPLSSSSGTHVFDVTGSDTDGDTLSFTMSCSSCPFQITNEGVINTNQVLSSSTVEYDIFVHVTDPTTSVGPRVLTVKISDINSDPIIRNLPFPTNISVWENQPVGTTVLQVVTVDIDTSQTLSYSLSVNPNSGQTLFTIDSTGLITTSISTDYETMADTFFNISVTVSDGQASDTESFNVIIQNLNEAPTFAYTSYSLSGVEEQIRGTSLGIPAYGITDPESDSINYSIDCYQFMMNSSTGEITFYAAYDLDLAGSSSTISCIVSADDGYLTSTATLIVTINDTNDNRPKFDQKTYTVTSNVDVKAGAVIGTLSATDADYSTLYGTVTYSINQTLLSSDIFGISGTGSLFAVQDLSALGSGTVHDISVTATDIDGNNDTTLVTIIIIDDTSTSVVTDSDDRYMTFIEDPKNVAWLTSFCLASFGSICLIGYLIKKHDLLTFWKDGLKEIFKRNGDTSSKTRKKSNAYQNKNMRQSTRANDDGKPTGQNLPRTTKSRIRRQKFRDIRHFINARDTQF